MLPAQALKHSIFQLHTLKLAKMNRKQIHYKWSLQQSKQLNESRGQQKPIYSIEYIFDLLISGYKYYKYLFELFWSCPHPLVRCVIFVYAFFLVLGASLIFLPCFQLLILGYGYVNLPGFWSDVVSSVLFCIFWMGLYPSLGFSNSCQELLTSRTSAATLIT